MLWAFFISFGEIGYHWQLRSIHVFIIQELFKCYKSNIHSWCSNNSGANDSLLENLITRNILTKCFLGTTCIVMYETIINLHQHNSSHERVTILTCYMYHYACSNDKTLLQYCFFKKWGFCYRIFKANFYKHVFSILHRQWYMLQVQIW